ncbi:MAG: hypothetical protein V4760_14065, partial [Bdellovibrionota bacterium]
VDGFLGARVRNDEHRFQDKFEGPSLLASWQWPRQMAPRFTVAKGELILRGENKKDPFASVIGHSTTTGDYLASVDIKVGSHQPGTSAGLAAYGESGNSIGVHVIGKDVVLIQRLGGKDTELARWLLRNDADLVTLRMQARRGHTFKFSFKAGAEDRPIGHEVNGERLPPWDLGIRVALTASNGEARFSNFVVEPVR